MRDGVGGGAKDFVASVRAIAGAVDPALGVFDPHTDGEGLGLHTDAALVERLKRIARRMADRHDDVGGGEEAAIGQVQPGQAVILGVDLEVGDAGGEAVFAAELFDGFADAHHHRHKAEGADVGVGFGQYVIGGARLDEFGQHLAAEMARVLDARIELAVGECPRAALAELHV